VDVSSVAYYNTAIDALILNQGWKHNSPFIAQLQFCYRMTGNTLTKNERIALLYIAFV